MAITYPDLICGAVLVAGSLDPKLEGMRWYNELATWKVVQLMIPESLLRSNREIQALQSELQRLEAAWPQLNRPTLVLQGMKDELVDPDTADYMEDIVAKKFGAQSPMQIQRFPEQGHFLIWDSPSLVTDAITSLPCNNTTDL